MQAKQIVIKGTREMKASLIVVTMVSVILLFGCKKEDLGTNATSGTISGTVIDASSSTLLAGASVVTTPPTSAVLTDASGKYTISGVNPGAYTVTAGRAGYTSGSVNVTVAAGGAATGSIPLTPALPGMILVAGGTFQMGDTLFADERPLHAVTVGSYYLDIKEVTVAEYRTFTAATGKSMPVAPSWGWSDDDPIVNVNWNDASAYAQRAGKRLPTEAEWEFAARSGNMSHGYLYSGSSTIGDVGWYISNSGSRTHAVGTKTPNEMGVFDLTGNAMEWCSDWYDAGYYSVSPSVNPKGPSSGTYRMMRGGSWGENEIGCRVGSRFEYTPGNGYDHTGFRCARDL